MKINYIHNYRKLHRAKKRELPNDFLGCYCMTPDGIIPIHERWIWVIGKKKFYRNYKGVVKRWAKKCVKILYLI